MNKECSTNFTISCDKDHLNVFTYHPKNPDAVPARVHVPLMDVTPLGIVRHLGGRLLEGLEDLATIGCKK